MITSSHLLTSIISVALQRKRMKRILMVVILASGSYQAFAQDSGDADVDEPASARDQAKAVDLPAFATDGQVPPISPVAGGNDPSYSDDPNYILESALEDEQEAATDNKGIVRPKTKPHVFINPSVRAAATTIVASNVKVEAFVTSGSGALHPESEPFGIRSANATGGVSSTVDFGLVNANFAYEHRQAYAEEFGDLKAVGDKVGASFNKTFILPVPNVSVTPALIVSNEYVDPYRESTVLMDGSISLTYKVFERLQASLGAGATDLNLYGNPQLRRNRTMKVTSGLSYKLTDKLSITGGLRANDTRLYGLAGFRRDRSISPSIVGQYAVSQLFTITCTAGYDRMLSNIYGIATYRFNIAPSLNLTVPL